MKKALYTVGIFSIMAVLYSCSPKVSKAVAPPETTGTDNTFAAFVMKYNTRELAEGQMLMEEKCGRCHQLKPVKNYTVEKWNTILNRMIPKAKLSTSDGDKVRAYIYSVSMGE